MTGSRWICGTVSLKAQVSFQGEPQEGARAVEGGAVPPVSGVDGEAGGERVGRAAKPWPLHWVDQVEQPQADTRAVQHQRRRRVDRRTARRAVQQLVTADRSQPERPTVEQQRARRGGK